MVNQSPPMGHSTGRIPEASLSASAPRRTRNVLSAERPKVSTLSEGICFPPLIRVMQLAAFLAYTMGTS